MKKFRLSFLLLSLLLIAVGARADEVTVNDGETATSGTVPVYGLYVDDFTASQFIVPAADLKAMDGKFVTEMTFYAAADKTWGNASFQVYLSEVKDDAFDPTNITAFPWADQDLVYEGSLSIVDAKMVIKFDAPYSYKGGNLLVGFRQTVEGRYSSCTWLGLEGSSCAIWGYSSTSPDAIAYSVSNFAPKVTFKFADTFCQRPTNLTISGITDKGATLSWTSDANEWNVSYTNLTTGGQDIFTHKGQPSFFFNVPNAGDGFRVRIRTVCDENNKSDWSDPITFVTDVCEEKDKCAISYELAANYSGYYGWYDAALQVVEHESGVVIETLTLDAGQESKSGVIPVCPGIQLDFKWVPGVFSGYYDATLCNFTITDINDEVILEYTAGTAAISEGILDSYLVDCNAETDCLTPADFAASDLTPHSATLSWTERGTSKSWVIMYMAETDDDVSLVEVDENPFIFSGLESETTYYALVYPTCDETKQSNVISFTTPPACVRPADVEVTPAATTAEVSWTGYSDSYIVQYREPAEKGDTLFFEGFENGLGEWTTVDNDGDGYNWEVVQNGNPDPNGNPRGFDAYHASSASYDNPTYTALTPDNWLISPEVDLKGVLSVWLRAQDPNYSGEYFAIYVSTEGNTVEHFLASESNVLVPETVAQKLLTEYIVDLSKYEGQKGYIAIRHFNSTDMFMLNVDNFGIYSEIIEHEWNTITTADESVVIDGLTPETTYEYRVQGVCEENSKWVTGTFTTEAACPVPSDLAVEPGTTTATVTWQGKSENYNLRYRKATEENPTFFEDFEKGMEGWTVIRNGEGTDYTDWRRTNSETTFSSGPIPAHSGKYVVMSRSYSGVGYNVDNWLISPEVTLDGTLKFWVMDDGSWHEYFEVYVSTTGKEIADFGKDAYYTPGYATNVWKQVSVDLSEFKGQKGYIAIRQTDYDKDYLFLDDFGIYGEPTEFEWQELTTDETTVELTGLEAGTDYEVQVQGVCDKVSTEWSESVFFTTVAIPVDLVLLDDDLEQPEGSKNTDILDANFGKIANVTLKDRVFYKDGNWNTLCLPFNLTEEQIANSPLAGATIKELYNAHVTGRHVDITFSQATEITSDWFYIFKWEEQGENIVNPVFNGVTIDYPDVEGPMIYTNDFKFWVMGNYSTVVANPAEENVYAYYLGADNKLRYSEEPVNLHTFRLYFNFFKSDVDPSAVEFNLNFDGEESTGIVEVDGARKAAHEGTYNLQGVKINEPKQKGVYIQNGRKVVVK